MTAAWTTTPTQPAPATGIGWSTDILAQEFAPGLGWQAAYQRVGATISEGSLTGAVSLVKAINQPVSLSGEGGLSASAVAKIGYRAAVMTGQGILWAQGLYPVFAVTVALSGGGQFEIESPEGLVGGIDGYSYQSGIEPANVNFYSEGTLAGLLGDGLSATTIFTVDPVALAVLAGIGTLSATADQGVVVDGLTATTGGERYLEPDTAGGVGTFGAVVSQIYSITGALAGGGTLSAVVLPIEPDTVPFIGTGALAATAYQYATASASFAGAGALSCSATPQFAAASALAGEGTLSATATKQVAYSATGSAYTATKSGTGSLTITTKANDYVIVDISGDTSSAETNILTIGGVAMTLLLSQPYNNNTSNASLKRYGLSVSTAGSKTISYSGSHPNDVTVQAVCYSNVVTVQTSTSVYGASGAASASQSPTCNPGDMIVSGFAADQCSSSLWTPSGGTNRYNGDAATSGSNYLVPLAISDATASTTFGISDTNVGNYAGIATVLSGS